MIVPFANLITLAPVRLACRHHLLARSSLITTPLVLTRNSQIIRVLILVTLISGRSNCYRSGTWNHRIRTRLLIFIQKVIARRIDVRNRPLIWCFIAAKGTIWVSLWSKLWVLRWGMDKATHTGKLTWWVLLILLLNRGNSCFDIFAVGYFRGPTVLMFTLFSIRLWVCLLILGSLLESSWVWE